jgi:hypothetical protein
MPAKASRCTGGRLIAAAWSGHNRGGYNDLHCRPFSPDLRVLGKVLTDQSIKFFGCHSSCAKRGIAVHYLAELITVMGTHIEAEAYSALTPFPEDRARQEIC